MIFDFFLYLFRLYVYCLYIKLFFNCRFFLFKFCIKIFNLRLKFIKVVKFKFFIVVQESFNVQRLEEKYSVIYKEVIQKYSLCQF